MPSVPFASVLPPAAYLLKRLTTVKPQEPKLTVGLDIGSSSVKAVALGPRKGGGARPVIGHHLVALEKGQEGDVSEAVKMAMSGLPMGLRAVNLSVSGQWVVIRIVEMPTMKSAEMRQALPFEAQRYLPFQLQDVVVDGATLAPADAARSWVLIVACKKDLLERRMDWAKGAGLEVALIDVDALALTNAFLASATGRKMDNTRALINVGALMTNLVIFQGDIPYLVRDIPWGGDKLLRNSAEQLGVEPGTVAEQLRAGPPSPELFGAMKLATEVLVTELQLSFDYFENRFSQPPEAVLISGGLAQCPGFLDALKSHLAQAVTPWALPGGLSSQFAVAYGLALRTD